MSTTLFYGGSAALSRAQATLPMLTGIRTEKINIQRDNPEGDRQLCITVTQPVSRLLDTTRVCKVAR